MMSDIDNNTTDNETNVNEHTGVSRLIDIEMITKYSTIRFYSDVMSILYVYSTNYKVKIF